MATIGTASHASQNNSTRRSYIATAPFHDYIYEYNVTNSNDTIVGTLDPLTGATCDNCPTGRILRETGRKLYPGANPGISIYLVSVYDSVTFLRGFINPNSRVFAVFNSDKPTYIPDNVSEHGTENSDFDDNLGAPVLTFGNIISTEGFVGAQSTIRDGNLYAGEYYYDNEPIVEAGVNFNVDPGCDEDTVPILTYATLYPNGTIESINTTTEPYTQVTLTANGNIYNTGNTSTMGDLYVQGNVSTSGDLSVYGNTSTLGSISADANITALRQIRSSTKTTLTRSTDVTMPLDVSLGQVFEIQNNYDNNFTIDASNTNLTGANVYLILRNLVSNNRIVTFGANIRETGGLTMGTGANATYCVSFICDGTSLFEIGRTGAILPT